MSDDSIVGYNYTHWDCDGCGEACESEGDITGEEVECDVCGWKGRIRDVM